MPLFLRFLILSIGLSALAASAHGEVSDAALGRAWARCAEEARLLAIVTDDAAKKKILSDTHAVLRAYAVATAGRQTVDEITDEVHTSFMRGLTTESLSERAEFLRTFFDSAEPSAERCARSFSENNERLEPVVREMIKRDVQPPESQR